MGAGAKPRARHAGRDAQNGIVEPHGDAAIMREEKIGDAGQFRPGSLVVDDLRLVGAIAARHDDRPVEPAEHQMMQWRRRQHEAERSEARRDILGKVQAAARFDDDDRRGGTCQCCFFRWTDLGITADHVEIACHQRKSFGVALLALAQPHHRIGVGRVAGEVIAAEALDRDDMAFEQEARCGVDIVEHAEGRKFDCAAAGFFKGDTRAADMTGDRLRVETPVTGHFIFAAAGFA